jgi:hypothetical protein
MNNIKSTHTVGVTAESNKNNDNKTVGGSMMTRQQRRKMERKMKKQNHINTKVEVDVYGFTVSDQHTIGKYGIAPIATEESKIEKGRKSTNPVYLTEMVLKVDNSGDESLCVVGVVHNLKEGLSDEKVMFDLVFSVLGIGMEEWELRYPGTLTDSTRIKPLEGFGVELEPSVLHNLNEVLSELVEVNTRILEKAIISGLCNHSEFRKTG